MAQDKKDLVKILKQELEFIEKGGYRTPQHAAWRPQPIFQDSPTCLNFGDVAELRPCEECALVEFVPSERLQEKFPCRHISLDEAGLTLDSLYRSGDRRRDLRSGFAMVDAKDRELGRRTPTGANRRTLREFASEGRAKRKLSGGSSRGRGHSSANRPGGNQNLN